MRLLIAFLFLVLQAAGQTDTAEPGKTVQVRSYVRKDGTVVRAYTRAAPGTGTAPRSTGARRAFQSQNPCPSTHRATGACPGYVVDHVEALACGGIDAPENMQWQSVEEGKAKDTWERKDCGRPEIISPSAFSAEPSTRLRVAVSPRRWEQRDHRTGNRRVPSGRPLRRRSRSR
jgi:hypothetical protein